MTTQSTSTADGDIDLSALDADRPRSSSTRSRSYEISDLDYPSVYGYGSYSNDSFSQQHTPSTASTPIK